MDRHLAGIAIVLTSLCCLLLGTCASASAGGKTRLNASLSGREDPSTVNVQQVLEETYDSMFKLMTPLYLFYARNDRWPADGQELLVLTRELGLPLDLSQFSQLNLHELQDGSLRVRFELAPPSQGGGEFVLDKPDFDDEQDQDLVVQQWLVV